MIYPPNIVPYMGNGMTIGLNGVIHVLVSHGIAIGAFALLILGERYFGSLAEKPVPEWPSFNKGFLAFVVFCVTIVGSVTGAGIWFTTMALASHGISGMVRTFFWAWFLEYFAFFGEAIVLLLLYFRWDALVQGDKRLLKRGAYAAIGFAVFSAVSITAILGFMLTPGNWVLDHRFWSGLLNPSFLPQLAARLSFSFIIGALVAMGAVAWWGKDSFRLPATKLYGKVLLASTALFVVSLVVYFIVTPRAFSSHIPFAVLTSHFSRYPRALSVINVAFFLMLFACAFAALSGRLKAARALIVPGLVAVSLLVAQFERVREFIRGPYLMPGYMYANGILIEEVPLLQKQGLAATSPWYGAAYPKDATNRGAYIFAQNCMICHTVGGLNDIRARLKGRPADGIYVLIGNIHQMVPFMPPFAGSEEERRVLTGYLFRVAKGEVSYRSLWRALVEEKGGKR